MGKYPKCPWSNLKYPKYPSVHLMHAAKKFEFIAIIKLKFSFIKSTRSNHFLLPSLSLYMTWIIRSRSNTLIRPVFIGIKFSPQDGSFSPYSKLILGAMETQTNPLTVGSMFKKVEVQFISRYYLHNLTPLIQ